MTTTPKYELTDETTVISYGDAQITLHRIRSLRAFGQIPANKYGGWLEAESNLSHAGNAWVANNAMVWGNARVLDNARVEDNARVYDNAQISGKARLWGNAQVYENATVTDFAMVCDNAQVRGNAKIIDTSGAGGDTIVEQDTILQGPECPPKKIDWLHVLFIIALLGAYAVTSVLGKYLGHWLFNLFMK